MPPTRPSRVPLGIKAAYGTGSMANGIKDAVFNQFLLFYYTGVLGLPGSLAGTALLIAMCFDAVSDPLFGYLSDHTRSRLGRRHPYIYAAAIPMGISVYLLLAPPADLGQTALFLWMTGLSISVRVALTLSSIPRSALVPEISLPPNGSPLLLPIIVGHLAIAIVPVIGLGILFSSMFKDAIDESELETGLRQEGVFSAAIAFTLKAVAGVGNLFGGMAIEWIDFPLQAAPGSVPADKVWWLGFVAGPGLMIFYAIGFYFLTGYKITRERYAEIRAELDRRASLP